MDESAFLRPPPYLDTIIERSKALDFSMPSEARTGAMLRMLSSSMYAVSAHGTDIVLV